MKKIRSLLPLIVFVSFIFSGCDLLNFTDIDEQIQKKNQSDKKDVTENNDFYYFHTIKQSENSITFDEAFDGKKLFVIYSNENKESLKLENQKNKQNTMQIYKSITNMGNGFYRDEVVFNNPEFIEKSKLERSTARSVLAYNNHENNKFYACIGENDGNEVFENKEFIKKADGKYCRIWFLDNNSVINSSILTSDEFKRLAAVVDSVFLKEKEIFGENAISKYSNTIVADSNTILDVLVYDLYGDASVNQQHGTFGFFNPNDFLLKAYNSESNECEVIHIDSFFLQADIEGVINSKNEIERTHRIESTLIHEFQHLLHYCQKSNSDTWFNEMLAMCAEDIFQNEINTKDEDSPKDRFEMYFNSPYKGFKNWLANNNPDVYYCYANAYAFGAYLMRNYGGVKLINQIATNSSNNEQSITDALKALEYNEDFSSVFQKFGMIYIMKEEFGKSLNKELTEKFKNSDYTLGAIDLDNYHFIVFDNEQNAKFAAENYIYSTNDYYKASYSNGTIVYTLDGPVIYKKNYSFKEEIQTYGFVVYYADIIDSTKTYNITKPNDKLTISIVVID